MLPSCMMGNVMWRTGSMQDALTCVPSFLTILSLIYHTFKKVCSVFISVVVVHLHSDRTIQELCKHGKTTLIAFYLVSVESQDTCFLAQPTFLLSEVVSSVHTTAPPSSLTPSPPPPSPPHPRAQCAALSSAPSAGGSGLSGTRRVNPFRSCAPSG